MPETVAAAPAASPAAPQAPNIVSDKQAATAVASEIVKPKEGEKAPEKPAEAAAPEPAKEERKRLDAKEIAELARVRREQAANRRQVEQLRAERLEFESKQADALRKAQLYDQREALKAKDHLEFLKAEGIGFEELAKRVIKGEVVDPAEVARAEAQKLFSDFEKAQAEKQAKVQAEFQAQRDAQAIESAKLSLRQIATAEPDRFEFVVAHQAYDRVWKKIDDYFNATAEALGDGKGQLLDFKEAMDEVEKELETTESTLLSGKKLQALLAKIKAPTAVQGAKVIAPQGAAKTGSTEPPRPEEQPETKGQGSKSKVAYRPFNRSQRAKELLAEYLAKADS